MLGSWFGQKSREDIASEGTTPRPSFGAPSDQGMQPPRLSADRPKRAFPTAFNTPHDAILSELHGTAAPPTAEASNRTPSFTSELVTSPDFPESIRDEAPSRSEGQTLRPTPNPTLLNAPRSSTHPELLLDPFDGMTLGVLIPRQDGKATDGEASPSSVHLPSSLEASQTGLNNVGSEAVWNHMSRILDLQSLISKKHLEMENIGVARGNESKKKGHRASTRNMAEASNMATSFPDSGAPPPIPPGLRREREKSTVSDASSTDEPEGNEEGVNVPSEEAEKIRMREEEFAKLTTQFEGRKEAINDIMGKLDELSIALTEFHNIPSPNIEFYGPRQTPAGSANASTSQRQGSGANSREPWSSLQDVPPVSNQDFDWSTQRGNTNAMPPRPQPVEIEEKPDKVIINPVPPKSKAQKLAIPTLLINSTAPQASIHDSPLSIGELSLEPQE